MTAPIPRRYVLTSEMDAFVSKASTLHLPAIIDGPTGTGKSVLAALIHVRGARKAGPYVDVGCAILPAGLADALLFGGKRGTWTGLHEDRDGYVKDADGGTLVLNDVDTLRWEVQGKLLGLLDTGRYRRVGGRKDRRADVQIIATTNHDPEELVAEGELRADLYGRLALLRFTCPALQARQDLPEVSEAVLRNVWDDLVRLNRGTAPWPGPPSLTPEALDVIEDHDFWPTGFRGLTSILAECIAAGEGGTIDAKIVRSPLERLRRRWKKFKMDGAAAPQRPPYRRKGTKEEEERKIRETLHRTRGNVVKAARELGMARSTLTSKLNEYRVSSDDFRGRPSEGAP